MSKLRVGLLIGNGGRVPVLRSAELGGGADWEIACAITCKKIEPPHLAWLREQGIPSYIFNWPALKRSADLGGKGWSDEECSRGLAGALEAHQVDLVVSAGWMPKLSEEFLRRYHRRAINVHPGLIPWSGEGEQVELEDGRTVAACRGKDAVAVALALGVPAAGCIIHYMAPEYDSGPVIWRRAVEVRPGESYESLATRIHDWEDVGLPQVLQWFAQGRVRVDGGRAVVEPVPSGSR